METNVKGARSRASRCETGEQNSIWIWRALYPVDNGEQFKDFKQQTEMRISVYKNELPESKVGDLRA